MKERRQVIVYRPVSHTSVTAIAEDSTAFSDIFHYFFPFFHIYLSFRFCCVFVCVCVCVLKVGGGVEGRRWREWFHWYLIIG